MNTSTGRPNSPRGSPLETARESILNTPLWLPLAVAALALLVLDVVVPANSKGAAALLSMLLGLAVAAVSIWVVVLRFSSQRRHRTLLHSLTTTPAVAGLSVLELHDLVLSALFRRDWGIVDYTIPDAPGDVVVMTSDRVRRAVFFEAGPQIVNVDIVRSREVAVRGHARLVVVSGGSFGPEAIVFARQIGADLVDAEGVLPLCQSCAATRARWGRFPRPLSCGRTRHSAVSRNELPRPPLLPVRRTARIAAAP